MGDVVVVGAGLAGLATAALLAEDGHAVTVLERDPSPPPSSPEAAWERWQRRGVAQFRQAYAVQPGLNRLLGEHLPRVNGYLEKLGAHRLNWMVQLEPGLEGRDELIAREDDIVLTARRPVMELAFALAAEDQEGITFRRGAGVKHLSVGRSSAAGVPHVDGVVLHTGETLRTDLVVDATGRNSRIDARLADIGCRPPDLDQQDNSTIYYTRFYRSGTGELPAYGGGAFFTTGDSIGLFLVPSDQGTWSIALWGMAEDRALRNLRKPEIFDEVVRRFPDRTEWLDAEPITDISPCVSGGDLLRWLVVDNTPVVTGVALAGDAHAFTEPRLGRGTILGVMQALALRDSVRRHLDNGPEAMALGWHEDFSHAVLPWLRVTRSAGRAFAAEMRLYARGERPELDGSDRGLVLNRAFERGARVDLEVGQWLLDLAGCSIHPRELLARPGVVDRIMEAGGDDLGAAPAGPSRPELLDLLSG